MTVQNLLEQAMALLPTNPAEDNDLQRYAVGWTNLSLAETFGAENAIRAANGEQELDAVPELTALTDRIPYDDALVRRVFVWSLAALIAKDDDDADYAERCRARAYTALSEITPGVPISMRDVWGDDA